MLWGHLLAVGIAASAAEQLHFQLPFPAQGFSCKTLIFLQVYLSAQLTAAISCFALADLCYGKQTFLIQEPGNCCIIQIFLGCLGKKGIGVFGVVLFFFSSCILILTVESSAL